MKVPGTGYVADVGCRIMSHLPSPYAVTDTTCAPVTTPLIPVQSDTSRADALIRVVPVGTSGHRPFPITSVRTIADESMYSLAWRLSRNVVCAPVLNVPPAVMDFWTARSIA